MTEEAEYNPEEFDMAEEAKVNLTVFPIITTSYRYMIECPTPFGEDFHIRRQGKKITCDLTEKLDFSFDEFMHHISTIEAHNGKQMIINPLDSGHPEFVKILEKLYQVYTVLISKPLSQKRNQEIYVFIQRVAVVRILINDLSNKVKAKPYLAIYFHKSILEMIDRMRQLKIDIEYIGMINQYMNNFNTMYKLSLPMFKRSNSHSTVGATKTQSIHGYGTFIPGIENIREVNGLEITDTSIIFHESRRTKCMVHIGEQSIKSFFESFIAGKQLTFRTINKGNPEVIISCPNNFTLHKKTKHPNKWAVRENCCGKEINLSDLPDNKIIQTNWKKSIMSKEQTIEYSIFYKNLLFANRNTAFENARIYFCPDEDCVNSTIGFVDTIKLNIKCSMCSKTFCSTCSVFEEHNTDNSECKTIEYGPGSKPCPNCNIPIFHNGGCHKMVCDTTFGGCNCSFCWGCQKKTCLQKKDLIDIQNHFKTLERPISFGIDGDMRAFLYLHPTNNCTHGKPGGVFYAWEVVRQWIDSDIHYTANGFPLSVEDANTIETMMNNAATSNT